MHLEAVGVWIHVAFSGFRAVIIHYHVLQGNARLFLRTSSSSFRPSATIAMSVRRIHLYKNAPRARCVTCRFEFPYSKLSNPTGHDRLPSTAPKSAKKRTGRYAMCGRDSISSTSPDMLLLVRNTNLRVKITSLSSARSKITKTHHRVRSTAC